MHRHERAASAGSAFAQIVLLGSGIGRIVSGNERAPRAPGSIGRVSGCYTPAFHPRRPPFDLHMRTSPLALLFAVAIATSSCKSHSPAHAGPVPAHESARTTPPALPKDTGAPV